jgi:hypothetical protein
MYTRRWDWSEVMRGALLQQLLSAAGCGLPCAVHPTMYHVA